MLLVKPELVPVAVFLGAVACKPSPLAEDQGGAGASETERQQSAPSPEASRAAADPAKRFESPSSAVQEPSPPASNWPKETPALSDEQQAFLGALPEWSGDKPEGWADCPYPSFSLAIHPRSQRNWTRNLVAILQAYPEWKHTTIPKTALDVYFEPEAAPQGEHRTWCISTDSCSKLGAIAQKLWGERTQLECAAGPPPIPRSPLSNGSPDPRTLVSVCEIRIRGKRTLTQEQRGRLHPDCAMEKKCVGVLACMDNEKNRQLPPSHIPH